MNEEQQSNTGPGFLDGNPRTMFVFGLVTGMAVILFMNNLFGVGMAGTGTALAKTGTTTQPSVVVDDVGFDGTAPSGTLAAVNEDDHVRGDLKKAKVVLIEYSDFQCPYCQRHDPTMQQLVEEYGDQVAWVYRHFPLSFHPNAEPTSLASECAAEQGKFWEFADAMFAGQTENLEGDAATADAFVQSTAKSLGLSMTKFNDCLESAKYQDKVDADYASGQAAGVSGTPATFVNGTLVSGAVPYASLKKVVDSAIAAAK